MADGRILEFPDGTSNAVIESTVKRLIAEKAAQQATDAAATSIEKRTMKTYEIKAPDGRTYTIDGPEGATEQDVLNAVLERKPEAGIPAKQEGMSMESVALSITFAVVGFGIAFFIERKITKTLQTKAQKVWLSIAASVFGLGFMGVCNQLFNHPINGLNTDHAKVFNYIVFNILVFPALIGLVIWWLNGKAPTTSTDVVTTLPTEKPTATKSEISEPDTQRVEDLYAQALNELEGGKRIDGVWAKCFADADGAENIAKAQYIKIRVSQLQLAINQAG